MRRQPDKGFTLLEMLLALALSAVLMATISTMVMPLLQTSRSQSEEIRSGNETDQMNEFFDTIERIANRGIAAFPTNLDRGKARSSLAIQFMGTGHDMSEDANGDGTHGIANMDPSGFRSTSTAFSNAEDDDNDGLVNEDSQNGLDDDNDGLIDEDPGSNDDNIASAGTLDYDDNNDGFYDTISLSTGIRISSDTYPWTPFIPNSLFAAAQSSVNITTHPYWNFFRYRLSEDDNEDGYSNNGPAVTWSARLVSDRIVCTTPIIEHVTSTFNPISVLRYEEYDCLENVQSFEVTRNFSNTGSVIFNIALSIVSAGKTVNIERRLNFL